MDVSVAIADHGNDHLTQTAHRFRVWEWVRELFGLLVRLVRGENVLPGVHRQVASGVGVGSVGVVVGIVLAYPTLALDAWTQDGDVTLSHGQAQWFGSLVYLLCIPGSGMGGVLIQWFGPRRLLLILLPLLALSWLPLTQAIHYPALLLMLRAAQGVLASSCGLCVYVYPCEIVEAGWRGLVGAIPEASFSLGFLLSHLLASLLHWSTVLLIVPIVFILPAIFVTSIAPESPIWLIHKGRINEAKDVLQLIRSEDANVEKELLSIQLSASSDLEASGLRNLLKQTSIILPILSVMTLVVLKESTGQIMVVLTTVRIFREIDMGLSPLWTSVLVSCARFGGNMVAVFVLNRFPRRILLTICALVAGTAMLFLANYFYATGHGDVWPKWMPFVFILVFVVAYGGGVGPLVSLFATELLPGTVRGLASGICNALLASVQFGLTYMASRPDFQFDVCFWAYTAGCFLLAGFALLLPETRNKKLEDLEQFWRDAKLNPTCLKCWPGHLNKNAAPEIKKDDRTTNYDGYIRNIHIISASSPI